MGNSQAYWDQPNEGSGAYPEERMESSASGYPQHEDDTHIIHVYDGRTPYETPFRKPPMDQVNSEQYPGLEERPEGSSSDQSSETQRIHGSNPHTPHHSNIGRSPIIRFNEKRREELRKRLANLAGRQLSQDLRGADDEWRGDQTPNQEVLRSEIHQQNPADYQTQHGLSRQGSRNRRAYSDLGASSHRGVRRDHHTQLPYPDDPGPRGDEFGSSYGEGKRRAMTGDFSESPQVHVRFQWDQRPHESYDQALPHRELPPPKSILKNPGSREYETRSYNDQHGYNDVRRDERGRGGSEQARLHQKPLPSPPNLSQHDSRYYEHHWGQHDSEDGYYHRDRDGGSDEGVENPWRAEQIDLYQGQYVPGPASQHTFVRRNSGEHVSQEAAIEYAVSEPGSDGGQTIGSFTVSDASDNEPTGDQGQYPRYPETSHPNHHGEGLTDEYGDYVDGEWRPSYESPQYPRYPEARHPNRHGEGHIDEYGNYDVDDHGAFHESPQGRIVQEVRYIDPSEPQYRNHYAGYPTSSHEHANNMNPALSRQQTIVTPRPEQSSGASSDFDCCIIL